MKNLMIGLLLGFLLNGLIVYAKENIAMNPIQYLGNSIQTTKITTPEGSYRIFIVYTGRGAGITAIKIK